MRTTVTVPDDVLERARALTGIEETSALIREGLETLIRLAAARRLAALGGTDPTAAVASRQRRAG